GNAAFSGDGSVLAIVESDKQKTRGLGSPGAPPSTQTRENRPTQPAGMPTIPMPMPDMSKVMEQMRKDPKKMNEQIKKIQEAMKNGDMSAGISMMESSGVILPPGTSGIGNKSTNSLRLLDVSTGRQLQSIPL